jgi:hypothetical protein
VNSLTRLLRPARSRTRALLCVCAIVLLGGAVLLEAQTAPRATCPNAPRSRLIVRERARALTQVNVREGANTSFSSTGRIVPGALLFVLEGPECSPTYAWYRVESGGLEGWVAEGQGAAYFVEPYPPG